MVAAVTVVIKMKLMKGGDDMRLEGGDKI